MSRFPKIFGAILLVLGLLGVLTTHLAGSALIVSLGVRAIEAIRIFGFAVAGVGALTCLLGFVPNVKRLIANSSLQKRLDGVKAEQLAVKLYYCDFSFQPTNH